MKTIIYKDNLLKNFLQDFSDIIGKPADFIEEAKKKDKKAMMLNLLYWYVDTADKKVPDAAKMAVLIAMAEANIKIRDGRFDSEKDSTNDTSCFFGGMRADLKQQIVNCFKVVSPKFKDMEVGQSRVVRITADDQLSFDEIVKMFSNVRHRFVHGKNIYCFRFNELSENLIYSLELETYARKKIKIQSTFSYNVFRKIMVYTALENIKNIV